MLQGPAVELSFAGDAPLKSELAGSWGTTFIELDKIYRAANRQAAPTTTQPDKVMEAGEVIIVTFSDDGTIDWTRTLFGISIGMAELRRVGDKCCVRRSLGPEEYEVRFCDYSPRSSKITVCWPVQNKSVQTQGTHETLTLEGKLRDDGLLEFNSVEDSQMGPFYARTTNYVLKRMPPRKVGARRKVKSRLAGAWAWTDENGVEKQVLKIRTDGTFDWSTIPEALFTGYCHLEQTGDKAGIMRGDHFLFHRVRHASYGTEKSIISLELIRDDDDRGDFALKLDIALQVDGSAIAVVTVTEQQGGKPESVALRLARPKDPCPMRDSIFSAARRELTNERLRKKNEDSPSSG
ncbi:hypothetical protein B7486_07375 [cyanobacterium TDX16]|nr:hypothetical protein B7486_07375 [cyanobacterium TDX16]